MEGNNANKSLNGSNNGGECSQMSTPVRSLPRLKRLQGSMSAFATPPVELRKHIKKYLTELDELTLFHKTEIDVLKDELQQHCSMDSVEIITGLERALRDAEQLLLDERKSLTEEKSAHKLLKGVVNDMKESGLSLKKDHQVQIDKLTIELRRKSREVENLLKDKNDFEFQMEFVNEKHNTKIQELKNVLAESQAHISETKWDKDMTASKYKEELSRLEVDNITLNACRKDLETQNHELEKRIIAFEVATEGKPAREREVEELKMERDALMKKTEEVKAILNVDTDDVVEAVRELSQSSERSKAKLRGVLSDQESVFKTLCEKTVELNNEKNLFGADQVEKNTQICALREELTAKAAKLERQSTELGKVRRELAIRISELQKKDEEMKVLRDDAGCEVDRLQAKIAECDRAMETFERNLVEKQEELNENRTKLLELEVKVTDAQRIEIEMTCLRKTLEDALTENRARSDELVRLEKEVEFNQSENVTKDDEIERLQKDLIEKITANCKKDAEIDCLQQDLLEKSTTNFAKDAEIERLLEELEINLSEIRSKNVEVEYLRGYLGSKATKMETIEEELEFLPENFQVQSPETMKIAVKTEVEDFVHVELFRGGLDELKSGLPKVTVKAEAVLGGATDVKSESQQDESFASCHSEPSAVGPALEVDNPAAFIRTLLDNQILTDEEVEGSTGCEVLYLLLNKYSDLAEAYAALRTEATEVLKGERLLTSAIHNMDNSLDFSFGFSPDVENVKRDPLSLTVNGEAFETPVRRNMSRLNTSGTMPSIRRISIGPTTPSLKELDCVMQRMSRLEDAVDDKTAHVNSLERKITKLEDVASLYESETEQLRSELSNEIRDLNDSLAEKVKLLADIRKKLLTETAALNPQLGDSLEKVSDWSLLLAFIENIMAWHVRSLEELQRSNKAAEENVAMLTTEHVKLRSLIEKQECENRELINTVESLSAESKAEVDKKKVLREDIAVLRARIISLDTALCASQQTLDEQKSETSNVVFNSNRIRFLLSVAENEKENLRHEIGKLVLDNEKQNAQWEELQTKCDGVVEKLDDRIRRLETKLGRQTCDVGELQRYIVELTSKIVQEKLRGTDRLTKANEEMANMTNEIELERSRVVKLTTSLNDTITTADTDRTELSRLRAELSDVTKTNEVLSAKLGSTECSSNDLIKTVETLNRDLIRRQETHAEVISKMETAVQELNEDLKKQKLQTEEDKLKMQAMDSDTAKRVEEFKEMENKMALEKKENENLKKMLTEEQSEFAGVNEILTNTRNMLKALTAELQEERENMVKLTSDFDSEKLLVWEANRELEMVRIQNEELELQLEKSRLEVVEIKEMLRVTKMRLSDELDILKSQLEAKEMELREREIENNLLMKEKVQKATENSDLLACFKKDIDVIHEENTNLKTLNEDLQGQLGKLSDEMEALMKSTEYFVNERKLREDLQMEFDSTNVQLEKLSKERESLIIEIEQRKLDASSKESDLNEKIRQLEDTIREIEMKLAVTEKACMDVSEELAQKSASVDLLTGECGVLREDILTLQKENENLLSNIEQLKTDVTEAQEAHSGALEDVSKLRKEYSEMQENGEMNLKTLNGAVQEKEQRIVTVEVSNRTLETENNVLRENVRKLKAEIVQTRSLGETKLEKAEEAVKSVTDMLDRAERRIGDLEDNVKDLEAAVMEGKDVKTQFADLEKDVLATKKEIQAKVEEGLALRKTIVTLDIEVRELRTQNELAEVDKKKMSQVVSKAEEEKAYLKDQVKLAAELISSLQSKADTCQIEIKDLCGSVESKKKELTEMLVEREETLKKNMEREKHTEELRMVIQQLEKKVKSLEQSQEKLKDSLDMKTDEVAGLTKNLKEQDSTGGCLLKVLLEIQKDLDLPDCTIMNDLDNCHVTFRDKIRELKTWAERSQALQAEKNDLENRLLIAQENLGKAGADRTNQTLNTKRMRKLEELNTVLHDTVIRIIAVVDVPNMDKLNFLSVRDCETSSSKLVDLIKTIVEERQDFEEENKNLDSEVEKQAEVIKSLSKEKDKLLDKVEELTNEVSLGGRRQVATRGTKLVDVSSALTDVLRQIAKCVKIRNFDTAPLATVRAVVGYGERVTTAVQKMVDEMQELQDQIKELDEENEGMAQKIKSDERARDSLAAEAIELKDELAKREQLIAKLESGPKKGCQCGRELKDLQKLLSLREGRIAEMEEFEKGHSSMKSQVSYLEHALDKANKKFEEEQEKVKLLRAESKVSAAAAIPEMDKVRMRGSLTGGLVLEGLEKDQIRQMAKQNKALKEICRSRNDEIKRLESELKTMGNGSKSPLANNQKLMNSPIVQGQRFTRTRLAVESHPGGRRFLGPDKENR